MPKFLSVVPLSQIRSISCSFTPPSYFTNSASEVRNKDGKISPGVITIFKRISRSRRTDMDLGTIETLQNQTDNYQAFIGVSSWV